MPDGGGERLRILVGAAPGAVTEPVDSRHAVVTAVVHDRAAGERALADDVPDDVVVPVELLDLHADPEPGIRAHRHRRLLAADIVAEDRVMAARSLRIVAPA